MESAMLSKFEYSEMRIINNRKRREKELKRHIIIFMLSVFLFGILVALLFSTKSIAADGSEKVLYKHYKSVEISSGDSIYSIASEYYSDEYESVNKLASEIMFINNINESSVLFAGNFLIVPYYDTYNG